MKTIKRLLSLPVILSLMIGLLSAAPVGVLAGSAVEVEEDVVYDIEISGNLNLGEKTSAEIKTKGEKAYFTFTPEVSGYYSFYSDSSSDTCGYLYDSKMNEIKSDDESGLEHNFKIIYEMTAGTAYVLAVNYSNSDETGSFDVCIIEYSGEKNVEKIDGKWYYTIGGKPDLSFTGFADNSNGRWRIEKGVVNFNYTNVVNEGGAWRYYSGGKWQKTAETVAKNSNGWWYIKNGVVQFGVTSVVRRADNNTWWYVKGGKVQFDVTSVVKRADNNTWWYVKKGQVQFGVTSVVKRADNNTWWYVKKGQVQFGATGVVKRTDNSTWWYVKKGQVQFGFTGIAKRVDNSTRWYVKKGQVQTGYSGKVKISGKTYTIKKGQVK